MRPTRRPDAGLTLVELLVVIVVLGVLAGIVVFGVGRFRSDATAAACRADVAAVNAAADAYDAVTGSYPRQLADLTVGQYLKTEPSSGSFSFDAGRKVATRSPACADGPATAATATPAAIPTPTATPPVSASPTPAPTSPAPAGGCTAAVVIDNSWPQGFQASITVTNRGTAALSPWTATWQMRPGTTVTNAWNATVTQSGQLATAQAPSWMQTLAPGASWTIGFIADGPSAPPPFQVTLGGASC